MTIAIIIAKSSLLVAAALNTQMEYSDLESMPAGTPKILGDFKVQLLLLLLLLLPSSLLLLLFVIAAAIVVVAFVVVVAVAVVVVVVVVS